MPGTANKQDVMERIKLDIIRIREGQDRTSTIATRHLRWEGAAINPNGWRLMGDLADDLEEILFWLGNT